MLLREARGPGFPGQLAVKYQLAAGPAAAAGDAPWVAPAFKGAPARWCGGSASKGRGFNARAAAGRVRPRVGGEHRCGALPTPTRSAPRPRRPCPRPCAPEEPTVVAYIGLAAGWGRARGWLWRGSAFALGPPRLVLPAPFLAADSRSPAQRPGSRAPSSPRTPAGVGPRSSKAGAQPRPPAPPATPHGRLQALGRA